VPYHKLKCEKVILVCVVSGGELRMYSCVYTIPPCNSKLRWYFS